MKTLLFIDSCLRTDSRTKKIADKVLENLSEKYTIKKIELKNDNISPLNTQTLNDRFNNKIDEKFISYAKLFATADKIIIAAPFWDMSFPAVLKAFFEQISLLNITFQDAENKCVGLCKASKILYITTRGMNIKTGSKLEQATPYIKAFANLCGIKKVQTISACNLDYISESEVNKKLNFAIKKGLKIIQKF